MSFTPEMTVNERIAAMNEAFGNPKGDFDNIDFGRLKSQCRNILDEFVELWAALHGYDCSEAKQDVVRFGFDLAFEHIESHRAPADINQIRDSLCDIQVFASGAQHFMGVHADDDMREVVGKVMTRFIKDEADEKATIAKHAAKGVTITYFEGDYPTMVLKSAVDQPDAPKGKFLKSASFEEPKFVHPKAVEFLLDGKNDVESRLAFHKALSLADKTEFILNDDTGQEDLYVTVGGIVVRIFPKDCHTFFKTSEATQI